MNHSGTKELLEAVMFNAKDAILDGLDDAYSMGRAARRETAENEIVELKLKLKAERDLKAHIRNIYDARAFVPTSIGAPTVLKRVGGRASAPARYTRRLRRQRAVHSNQAGRKRLA